MIIGKQMKEEGLEQNYYWFITFNFSFFCYLVRICK